MVYPAPESCGAALRAEMIAHTTAAVVASATEPWTTSVRSRAGSSGSSACKSGRSYCAFVSISAQTLAASELGALLPGVVAQPPFSMKVPCWYWSCFFNSASLAEASFWL